MLKVLQVTVACKRLCAIKSVFLHQAFPKDLAGPQPQTSVGKLSFIIHLRAHLALKRMLCCFHAVIYRIYIWSLVWSTQIGVLQGLALHGDHPGCPLLDGETETAWTVCSLCWQVTQVPPCLSLLCPLITVRDTCMTYTHNLCLHQGQGRRLKSLGYRCHAKKAAKQTHRRGNKTRNTYGV